MCVWSWGLFINFSSQSRRKLKGKSTWVRFWTETLSTSTEELSAFFKCHTPKFFFHSAGFWMGRQEKYLGRPLMDFYCYRSALSALKLSDVMQIIKLTMKRGHMGLQLPTACLHDVAHSKKKKRTRLQIHSGIFSRRHAGIQWNRLQKIVIKKTAVTDFITSGIVEQKNIYLLYKPHKITRYCVRSTEIHGF